MTAVLLGPHEVARAAKMLREGALVAFPTETVYGVAAMADEGFDSPRLRAFKAGRTAKFSAHLPDAEAALALCRDMAEITRHAVTVLTPHEATVVAPLPAVSGGLGLRVVTHPLGSEFLRLSRGPVVATSANEPGDPPLRTSEGLMRLPGVDAVLDGGELPKRPASTVVRMRRWGVEVLRRGALSAGDVAARFTRTVHFVCLGNLNRSAFAEAYVRAQRCGGGGISAWQATSSGIIAHPRARVPREMAEAGCPFGVGDELAAHRPRRFSASRAAEADRIVALGPDVAEEIRAELRKNGFASAAESLLAYDVPDPMGGEPWEYVHTAKMLADLLKREFAEPLAEE